MAEHIRERITRKLENITEDRLYMVLDYVEFLESKYAARQNPAPNAFQKFAEGIEDKMRAGRVSASTIAETMGLLNRAVGVLNGFAAAGKSVAADLANAAQRVGTVVVDATAPTGSAGSTAGSNAGTGATPPAASPPSTPTAPPATPPGPSAGAAGGPDTGAPTS